MIKTVGLIGCGSVAQENYVMVLRQFFPGARKLFYDTNHEAADQMAAFTGGSSSTLVDLIANSDFTIITTPPETHYELLMQSLRSGNSVFCEKPFLLNLREANEVIDRASHLSSKVFAGHVRRFFPSAVLARDFIQTGLLGPIHKIEVFEGGRFSWDSHSGYTEKSAMGGVLPDTGSHSLDSMLFATGLDTAKIKIHLYTKHIVPTKEPSHVFKAEFAIESTNNQILTCSILLSRREQFANKINIYGNNGCLEMPLDMTNAVRISTKTGHSVVRTANPTANINVAFQKQFHHILFEGGTLLMAERFTNTTSLLETLLNTDQL